MEGDNFDALRHLRMSFAGHVKCILIDPPYNTGKKDFVYTRRRPVRWHRRLIGMPGERTSRPDSKRR